VHEILRSLPLGSRLLDLGCASGSFSPEATLADVVRVDRDVPSALAKDAKFVQADAASLPFEECTFDAVVSNHSLEHFADLEGALREVGRVIRPGASLFVAVPDASTLTDRLYRWLARGGGHVNAFTSPGETVALIERATGLPHVGTRTLCSSLSFLNRRNSPRPAPRRLLLVGAGYEWSLCLYVWISRRIDALLKTRLSIYGWAFYFGNIVGPVDAETWKNVCVRCGSGMSPVRLQEQPKIRRGVLGVRIYRCPQCGARNPFTQDERME
jgi:SAM-dependent methyltransferase